MLTREEIIKDLEKSNALLKGHFLLSSGLHSRQYVQCAMLLRYPVLAEKFCRELANIVKDPKPDLVVGPALGGVVVAYETARALNLPGIFTERKDGQMLLRRNFTIEPGARVLVVEDVVTTGGSVKEVIEVIKEHKGNVVGVASLIDRGCGKVDFGVPFKSLISLEIETFEENECLLCQEGSKPVKPGSRS